MTIPWNTLSTFYLTIALLLIAVEAILADHSDPYYSAYNQSSDATEFNLTSNNSLQDVGGLNVTHHDHHVHAVYTASLLLVAVPSLIGLSAAALLVKRNMSKFEDKEKGVVLTDIEDNRVAPDEENDHDRDAQDHNSKAIPHKGVKSFWAPNISRSSNFARPKSFYVNIQKDENENFLELTLATPMEDQDDYPGASNEPHSQGKPDTVYNLRI